MAIILDGRSLSSTIMEELKGKTEELKGRGVQPTLALILVGEDEYSRRYVELKTKRCEEVGVAARVHHHKRATHGELIELIRRLNADASVHGVMVQLPLPQGLNELATVEAISPDKDVDGLNPSTLGKILMGEEAFLPAGVEAITELLKRHDIEANGKHWVIVGLSNIIGKPLAAYLCNSKVAFTCCKADEPELAKYTKDADVLVVDVGRKWFVTVDMVKRNVVILDNGNNYEGKKVYGDVDFDNIKEVASAITPVPGGIGPLLITMLIRNTLKAAEQSSR